MSMVGCFLLVPEIEVQSVLSKPSSVSDIVEAAYEEHGDDLVDVDKAWHCLHYLLTGTAWEGEPPLNFVAIGGTEVGDVDVGYGPARAFRNTELRIISEALEPISADDLRRRFDGPRMDALEIYPDAGRWTEIDPTTDRQLHYFLEPFSRLKDLLRRGSRGGSGLLVWLC